MARYENTRAHYRIVYPVTARPRFRASEGGWDHAVIDCSERGVRFHNARPPAPVVGSAMEGTLFFPDGQQERISGVVVRTFQGEVALHLTVRHLSFNLMIQQQRYIKEKFPLFNLID